MRVVFVQEHLGLGPGWLLRSHYHTCFLPYVLVEKLAVGGHGQLPVDPLVVTDSVPVFMVRLLVGRNVSVRFQPVQILLGCVTVEGHFTATIVAMSVVVVMVVRQMVVIVLRTVVVILPRYR